MALDPHPDREPGMDARVVVHVPEGIAHEFARTADDSVGPLGQALWFAIGEHSPAFTWARLAEAYPDAEVVLP